MVHSLARILVFVFALAMVSCNLPDSGSAPFQRTFGNGAGTGGAGGTGGGSGASAPSAPMITTPLISPYTTSGNSITIAGACLTGATVNLTGADTLSTSCASSAYTFTTAAQSSDGTYNYSVTQSLRGLTSTAANQQWVRDTAAPTVTKVTSSPTSKTFYIGDTVSIQVVFGEAVTVAGGTPSIALSLTGKSATYVSGSGTTTLTFNYTTVSGDSSAQLGSGAIALNGATITDAAGNNSNLTVSSSLSANTTLVISNTATPLACDSGSLSTTCTISTLHTIANAASISPSGNIVVASGGFIATAPTNTATLAVGGNITVQSGGSIAGNFTLSAVNITIDSGGSINADGLGGAGGTQYDGAGAGSGGGTSQAGGGYGGIGGLGLGGGGTTYGSATAPVSQGSGGGAGSNASGNEAGPGGGVLQLTASGTLTINGTLDANGKTGTATGSGGGGSGGSVYINMSSGTIAGTGSISASGGAGGSGGGGGGGGGRISLVTSAPFGGAMNVSGGVGHSPGMAGSSGTINLSYGAADASSFCDTGTMITTCTVSSSKLLPSGYTLTGSGNLTVATGGLIKGSAPGQTPAINMSGTLDIQSGGSLYGNFTVQANNITVETGGVIDANAFGFAGGIGYGAAGLGTGGASAGSTAGGGYGGAGGANGWGAGVAYGSATSPSSLGSGGSAGGNSNSYGGSGGGLLSVTATSTLTVNGTIRANGSGGLNVGGGGSGGTVVVSASTLAGSGAIQAQGGAANGTAGGGGGGRIKLTYGSSSLGAALSSATWAAGGSGTYAGGTGSLDVNGTLY